MQQYILDFPQASHFLDEDYVVSNCNAMGFSIISAWPNLWGCAPFSKALLLIGGKNSGKSHLAHIWQRRSDAYFISPNEKIDEQINHKSAFIIEDIDSGLWKEALLVYNFNLAHEAGKYLLMTSSDDKSEMSFKLADLNSRIMSVNSVNIESPDSEMMKMLLMKRFSERNLKVAPEVISYIAIRINRDYKEVDQIVQNIDKLSLEMKRNITIPLIKNLL